MTSAQSSDHAGEASVGSGMHHAAGGDGVRADHVVGTLHQLHDVGFYLLPYAGACRRRASEAAVEVLLRA